MDFDVIDAVEKMGKVLDFIEGAGVVIFGAALVLGILVSAEEDTPNDPADIPTAEQIKQKQQDINKLNQQIQDLASGTVSAADAGSWETQTRQALERIEVYRHQMFTPGDVTQIREALNSAEEFRRQELHQAANTTLYQAWQQARLTEKRVLDEEKKWQEAAMAYLACHGSMQQLLKSTSSMPVQFDTDRGKETLNMDADFWSRERISAIRKQLPEEALPQTLTLEQVRQLTGQVTDLAQALSREIRDAAEDFRASQQRMELCEAVYTALADRGWTLDEGAENGFEKQDPRRDACLSLYSAARDKLEFTFSGADRVTVKTRFQNVKNQGLNTYLENLLRKILNDDGFTVTHLTGSV